MFEAGEYDRAYELLGPASNWLQGRGRVREGLRVLEPFLDESVRTQMDRTLLGQLLGTVGISHHRLGAVQKAIGYHEQALVIVREIGDRQGEGSTLGNLGIAYATLGEVQKAIGYYEQANAIGEQIGDPRIVEVVARALESISDQ